MIEFEIDDNIYFKFWSYIAIPTHTDIQKWWELSLDIECTNRILKSFEIIRVVPVLKDSFDSIFNILWGYITGWSLYLTLDTTIRFLSWHSDLIKIHSDSQYSFKLLQDSLRLIPTLSKFLYAYSASFFGLRFHASRDIEGRNQLSTISVAASATLSTISSAPSLPRTSIIECQIRTPYFWICWWNNVNGWALLNRHGIWFSISSTPFLSSEEPHLSSYW